MAAAGPNWKEQHHDILVASFIQNVWQRLHRHSVACSEIWRRDCIRSKTFCIPVCYL